MMRADALVYVVDDDSSVRDAVADLLASSGLRALTYASAQAYVSAPKPDLMACLILDVALPDINGLDLQGMLADGTHPPVVFITGRGDIPSSVRAMKAGAVDFLPKPFAPEALLVAVRAALDRDRDHRRVRSELATLTARHTTLTPREREVMPLVVRGLLNKQAAIELGISEVTLQIHRGQIMRKMGADSLADLVRMSVKLGMNPDGPGRRLGPASDVIRPDSAGSRPGRR